MLHLSIVSPENLEILIKLLIAMLLGGSLGVERILAHKTAGMRTYALVSMGACLFVLVSELYGTHGASLSAVDPMRMASQIVVGVGFLGAGLIVLQDKHISGLTTASGLWVSAAIGTATGFGEFFLSITATILTLFVFSALWYIESEVKHVAEREGRDL